MTIDLSVYPNYYVGEYHVEPVILPGNTIPVWRIRETDGYALYADPGIGCWCLIERDVAEGWPRAHYCYDGGGFFTLIRLMVAAVDWDWTPLTDTSPQGWTRNVMTGERRPEESWGDWWIAAMERVWPEALGPRAPSPSADPSASTSFSVS